MSKKKKRICKGFRRSAGHEGEPCKMPAVEGSDYCKFHGGGAVGKKTGKGGPKGLPKPEGAASFEKGNTQSIKHGAYSARLLPEEREIYEQITEQFETELGGEDNLSASDRLLIFRLATNAAKLTVATEKGAPPEARGQLHRIEMDLLRELKSTRASKDSTGLTGNSPAEVVAALLMKVRAVEEPKQMNVLTHDPDVIDADVVPVNPDGNDSEE